MKPSFRLMLTCVVSSVLLTALCSAQEPAEGRPILNILPDSVEIDVPAPEQDGQLYQLEITEDLESDLWIPIARGHDGSWEPLFPNPRQISDLPSGARLTDALKEGAVFYRITQVGGPNLSDAELASRFLQQATFGPTVEAIDALVGSNLDFGAWIDGEIVKPVTYLNDILTPALEDVGWKQVKANVWYQAAINADDQLRQRMAWALSQILVISATGLNNTSRYEDFLIYYDILLEHALGNYRDLLEDVTYSPMMGEYLTYDGNRKAQGAQKPDENYAREVMQLFTIGLWELNMDGSLVLDSSGEPIPTYSNTDIETFARVFTGLTSRNNRTVPMSVDENNHDTEEKVLLDGVTTLPADQTTAEDISDALDYLFEHPNTAPFISRLLIQRLTCSNPSPGYIQRVAEVFADNGSGERGDLAAVARAILMDEEARQPLLAASDSHGKFREPLVRFMHLCRAFSLSAANGSPVPRITRWLDPLPQYPFESPSVFNFYLPDHQPPGTIVQRDLFAPEFQIMNDATTVKFMNAMLVLVTDGLANPLDTRNEGNATGTLDYTEERALAHDAAALVDHLDVLLTAGRLRDTNRQLIIDAVEDISASNRQDRVIRALRLFVVLPEFSAIY